MPGFILHLTATRFYLEYLSDSDPLKHSAQLQNDFYVGNLLPDVGKDKAVSHFRDPNFRDRMLEWPKPQWFCQKYPEYMSDPVCRGYWLHLMVDKYFLGIIFPEWRGSWIVKEKRHRFVQMLHGWRFRSLVKEFHWSCTCQRNIIMGIIPG